MNKNIKIPLCIGIIILIIALNTIIIVKEIDYMTFYYELNLKLSNPNLMYEFWVWEIFRIVMIRLPLVISDISIIKNICIFLKGKHLKYRKTLFWASTLLSLLVIITSFILDVLKLENDNLKNDILLYLWPISIAALILGFIRKKKRKV